jgi:hypothetical protein
VVSRERSLEQGTPQFPPTLDFIRQSERSSSLGSWRQLQHNANDLESIAIFRSLQDQVEQGIFMPEFSQWGHYFRAKMQETTFTTSLIHARACKLVKLEQERLPIQPSYVDTSNNYNYSNSNSDGRPYHYHVNDVNDDYSVIPTFRGESCDAESSEVESPGKTISLWSLASK